MFLRFAFTLLISIVLCGCSRQSSPTVFVDPALATLVSPDAVFIAGIRVQQVQATPFYERYIRSGKIPAAEEFAVQTGLDVHKDLWEVLIAFDGSNRWVMLRGKFTEMGMEPRINKAGAGRMGYKGYTMLGDESMAVVFLNPTTAVAASVSGLRKIIDNRDKTTGIPARLSEKITSISSKNQVWFAGDLSKLGAMGEIVGGIDFRSGMEGYINLTAKSAGDARRLLDAVGQPEGIKVQNDGSAVALTFGLPIDRVDTLVDLIRRLALEAGWRRRD
jgi:hypothetical protein